MPIYEYRCNECQQIFEEWQTSFEDLDLQCPICGGGSQRVMSNTSFVLKGTGWYTTDYCGKPAHTSGDNGDGKNGSGGNGNGKAPSDTSGSTDSAGSGKSESVAAPTAPAAAESAKSAKSGSSASAAAKD